MLLSEEIHSGGLIFLLTLIDTMCCVDSYQYQVPHEILCMHYLFSSSSTMQLVKLSSILHR